MGPMNNLLHGIKILDMSRVLAGPFASMILADLGAEVIKVEEPNNGDETRNYEPIKDGISSYFTSINLNKNEICLDLTKEKDFKTLLDLVKESDVIIHNFLPTVLKKLNLGYENLHRYNEKIIYVSISAFSERSRKYGLPGYDIIMQGETGLISVTGIDKENLCRVGNSTVDIYTGYMAAIMILSAIIKKLRYKDFKGMNINVPLFNCGLFSMTYLIPYFSLTGNDPSPMGISHLGIVPYQKFETKDRPIILAVANNNIWKKFTEIEYFSELAQEMDFATNERRVGNKERLVGIIQKKLLEKPSGFWIKLFQEKGIPAGNLNKISDIANDNTLYEQGDLIRKEIKGVNFVFPSFPALIDGNFIDFLYKNPPDLCENKDKDLKNKN